MVLLIDNYDSFSYNLVQLIGTLEPDIRVIRNDEMTVAEIQALSPTHIILSPGPGRPDRAGICEEVVRQLGSQIPILGVCLGHQAICEVYGATVSYAEQLMHGKMSVINLQDSPIFQGLGKTAEVARYHSLVAIRETIPSCLRVTAATETGEIMAVQHEKNPVYGVQFHPESIMTPDGMTMLKNFLQT
ncbi:MAG: aminodeoxychorismate/anthranilate synthase component II [Lachnospiraceae bacterium]|nr:aminodeoxychorismate/anthranilate synthase component II [Lachnospiraceae bacterium]